MTQGQMRENGRNRKKIVQLQFFKCISPGSSEKLALKNAGSLPGLKH